MEFAQEGTVIDGVSGDKTNVALEGAGEIKGYYDITLNANGGAWTVVYTEGVESTVTSKTIKVEKNKVIGTVLDISTGFIFPVNGTKGFNGWLYISRRIG